MKKTLCIMLSLFTLMSTLTTFSAYGEKQTSGDYEYIDLGDGNAVLYSYKGSEAEVVIPTELDGHKIVSIYAGAYQGNKSIVSVTVPESIGHIPTMTFENCSNLSKIDLPDTDIEVSPSAFTGTPLGNDPNNYDDGVFYLDNHLISGVEFTKKDYTVKSGTVYITQYAFCENATLESITIPSSVKMIGHLAFGYCENLKTVKLSEGLETVKDYCFDGCTSLKSITIPSSVKSLSYGAFSTCENLKIVKLSEGLETVKDYCFDDCTSLEEVALPDSVSKIGENILRNTSYYNNVKNWDNGVLYSGKHLIKADASLSGEYTVRDNTVSIADFAFFECSLLTKIELNDTLKIIGTDAFSSCEKLTSITVPESVTSLGEHAMGYNFNRYFDEEYVQIEEHVKAENFVIKGITGSAAESYAKTNEITFKVAENNLRPTGFKLYDALFVHAVSDSEEGEAWHAWQNVKGDKYFFLPSSANAKKVDICNAYSEAVTLNGVNIPKSSSAKVPYEPGKKYDVTVGGEKFAVYFMRSTAEAAVFINNSNADGNGTSLTEYLDSDKSRTATATGAIVTPDGKIDNTVVKKIKGRGNSTWRMPKKSYNVTYNDKVSVAGMKSSKKYSLLANYQDDSLSRNRLLYDISDAVGMPYSSDSRYVDFYSNGKYLGSYQMCEKIEVGKNSLISDFEEDDYLDEQGNVKEDFPFLCEVDAGAGSEDYYVSLDNGIKITIKAPELDKDDKGYSEVKEYVKTKLSAFYNAANSKNTDLSKYADMDSITNLYLINELGKNWDSGVSSLYFTYKADENGAYKFYGSPVWDYDNSLGNAAGIKDELNYIGVQDYTEYTGWWCKHKDDYFFYGSDNIMNRLSKNNGIITNSKKIWKEYFIPAIDHFRNAVKSRELADTLYTRNKYFSLIEGSAEMNYKSGWKLKTSDWVADHSQMKTAVYDEDTNTYYVNKSETLYENNFKGAYDYCADWLISRAAWLSKEFGENVAVVEVDNSPAKSDTDKETEKSSAPKTTTTSASLKAGEKFLLVVTGGKVKSYKSSNSKVATVKNGMVTGLKKGSATITAKLTNGAKAVCKIKVTTDPTVKIGGKKFNKNKTYSVKKGGKLTVAVTGKAAAVNNKYKTSNKKTAKITSKTNAKKLTIQAGKKAGKATITLTVNGVSFKIKVKVK